MSPDLALSRFLGSGEPAFLVSERGNVIAWNHAAERATGVPAAEVLGSACWSFVRGLGRRPYCGECLSLQASAPGAKDERAEIVIQPPNGPDILLDVRTVPVRTCGGDVCAAVHLFRKAQPWSDRARFESHPAVGSPFSRNKRSDDHDSAALRARKLS